MIANAIMVLVLVAWIVYLSYHNMQGPKSDEN
jgi:hypothetical protein